MNEPDLPATPDERYQHAVRVYGADIARFVVGYERDPSKRQELLQEVHLALWKSMAGFRDQCSLRTWVYRVANNVGVTHVQRSLRTVEHHGVTQVEDVDAPEGQTDIEWTERRIDLASVIALVQALAPLDREVMLLYLEDLDAAAIGEITGLSPGGVTTRVHRVKAVLAGKLRVEGRRT
jgi:RNA polymerase sigma-70 factor, ECF subfamily